MTNVSKLILDRQIAKAALAVVAMTIIVFMLFHDDYPSLAVQYKSGSFPECRGVIDTVSIVNRASGGTRNLVSKALVLQFSYEVNGATFHGTKYAFYEPASSPWDLTHLASEYSPGQSVPVYYDPNNPANGALTQGIGMLFCKGVAIRSFCALFAVGIILYGLTWIVIRIVSLSR